MGSGSVSTSNGRGGIALKRIARIISHLAIALVGLAAVALLFALVVPIDAEEVPTGTALLEVMASRVETLRFQLGLAIGAATLWLIGARRWRFAAIGALVAAWGILPAVIWHTDDRSAVDVGPSLRVASFNLGGRLAKEPQVLAEIESADADVLLILEYTPEWQTRLRPMLDDAFEHRVEAPRPDNFGMAVFSRVAWVAEKQYTLTQPGTPQFRFEFPWGDTRLVLHAVHPHPPTRPGYVRHRTEFVELLRRVDAETLQTVLAGDFNFVDHGPLAAALHARGFVNAHALAGSGRGTTWPVHSWLHYVPGIRIDHVYVGAGVTATDSWVGDLIGSDHRPIAATVVGAN